MTKNYTTQTFDKNHYHFGGLVHNSDFCTDYKAANTYGSKIAKRIEADFRWENKLLTKGAQK